MQVYVTKNYSKWQMHPNIHCSDTSNHWKYQRPKKSSINRLNLKEMWYIYTFCYYLHRKTATAIVKLCHGSAQGSYTKWTQQQRKKTVDDVTFRQHKRDTGEVIYNTKGDSEIQTHTKKKKKKKKKGKGQGWIRRLVLMYTEICNCNRRSGMKRPT